MKQDFDSFSEVHSSVFGNRRAISFSFSQWPVPVKSYSFCSYYIVKVQLIWQARKHPQKCGGKFHSKGVAQACLSLIDIVSIGKHPISPPNIRIE